MKLADLSSRRGIGHLAEAVKGRWLVVLVVGIFMVAFAGLAIAGKSVVIQADGRQVAVMTFKTTVGEALAQANIVLGDYDSVVPAKSEKIEEGIQIQVLRAFPVKLMVDGQVKEIITPVKTVDELIKMAGVQLGPLDRVSPELTVTVSPDVPVEVIRVEEKTITVNVEIPYAVDRRQDQTLERGINRVVQKGKNGLEKQLTKVTYENGREIKREVISSEVVKEPTRSVIAMGSLTSVSRGGERLNFDRALEMTATAYTYTGRNTATGIPPYVGGIAVDPKVIPLGSKVYVDGYGYAKAVDRGGSIVGNRIDVFLETKQECNKWGRRQVKVFVLE